MTKKVLLIALLLCLPLAVWGQTTATEAITQDTDDCGYYGGTFATDAAKFEWGSYAGTELEAGLRFQAVPVAQGATVISATLKMIVQDGTTENIDMRLYCEDTSDAATFSNQTDFDNRARTTGSNLTSVTIDVSAGDTVSFDCTNGVQETISRGDWSSGNDLAILAISETGGYTQYIRFADYAYYIHVLEITYTTGGGSGGTTTRRTVILSGGGK